MIAKEGLNVIRLAFSLDTCAYWYEFQATSFVHHTKKTMSFVRGPNTS